MDPSLHAIYGRPGFLLRRANQIALAHFLAASESLGITPSQFGILTVIASLGSVDQTGVSGMMNLDRSTVSLVIGLLEQQGLIKRQSDPADRRRRLLTITAAGREVLRKMQQPARIAQERVLAVFDPVQREEFMRLLKLFVDNHTESVGDPEDAAVIANARRPAPVRAREARQSKARARTPAPPERMGEHR